MIFNIKDNVVINSEGWLWPKNDGDGNYEGPSSCWHYMKTHNETPNIISSYVNIKNVCVQAGGNAGYYVKKYSELFKVVYTFEPDPVNFLCLNANVSSSNVIKFQACLGNKHECVGLNKTTPDTGSTHVHGNGSIPTLTVDDLNLNECNLIHFDIEGYELFALEGSLQTILKFKPIVAFECHDAWAMRYNVELQQVENFLTNLGYKLIDVAEGDKIFKHESM